MHDRILSAIDSSFKKRRRALSKVDSIQVQSIANYMHTDTHACTHMLLWSGKC